MTSSLAFLRRSLCIQLQHDSRLNRLTISDNYFLTCERPVAEAIRSVQTYPIIIIHELSAKPPSIAYEVHLFQKF